MGQKRLPMPPAMMTRCEWLIVFALFIICVLFMLYVVDGYAILCDVYRLTRQRLSHHEARGIASRGKGHRLTRRFPYNFIFFTMPSQAFTLMDTVMSCARLFFTFSDSGVSERMESAGMRMSVVMFSSEKLATTR